MITMHVVSEPGNKAIVKRAESPDDRLVLAREARTLAAVAHPGVVRLMVPPTESPPAELKLEPVSGDRLCDLEQQPTEVTAGWGAALATTIADLHDIGYAHRAVSADHVLFDSEGRPVLCGFGRAMRATDADNDEWSRATRSDNAAVARLVLERLPMTCHPKLRRTLTQLATGRGVLPRRVGARMLARQLVTLVPEARLASEQPAVPLDSSAGRVDPRFRFRRAKANPDYRNKRRLPVVAVGGAGVVGIAVFLALSRANEAAPAVNRSGRTVILDDSRYGLRSAPGEKPIVVLGRWSCTPDALPAVLDLASGTVWVFDSRPSSGAAVSGRLVGRVPEATGIAPEVMSATSGFEHLPCDDIAVTRRVGPALVLDPRRPAP